MEGGGGRGHSLKTYLPTQNRFLLGFRPLNFVNIPTTYTTKKHTIKNDMSGRLGLGLMLMHSRVGAQNTLLDLPGVPAGLSFRMPQCVGKTFLISIRRTFDRVAKFEHNV